MNTLTLNYTIIMLCILDYLLTIIGIQMGYVKEINPIFNYLFIQGNYSTGLIYKVVITLMGLQILENNKEEIQYKIILYFLLSVYLSINSIHILYFLLGIT